ncbi:MAG: type ISP restriction/modification enzyme [Parvibaculum sp.]|uniref:type ISP restriction/modification enzyme n=1 Tax=Parvibaculum sp. TaxID=2024848 RepID=UPI002726B93B|nr:type ISP restriction/modification enzyme [Parvibaculum sp.]MDO8837396.1 type ISP restriction/modification enzyme [Parvibaculum sp.]
MSAIGDYLSKIQAVAKSGKATEHSYRSAIESLFHAMDGGVTALNEPKRVDCGAPDFIIQRKDIVIGHVEAKDIDVDLRALKGTNKEQQERYLKGLPNLIYTNGIDFEFFRDGERMSRVSVATLGKGVELKSEKFEELENLLKDFLAQTPQSITSPAVLAKMMAGKATLIKDIFGNVLRADKEFRSTLSEQYSVFKEQLIHDITPEDFADIYAETIAYGMFAARLHDTTLDTFSRQEALELLPKSNPFLRNLFGYIAGPDLDDRIRWIIDDLAEVFQACDLGKLMSGFGKLTGRNDPFLHFYETFLAAYNPAKRKARGVWYTPEPVVNFIVRAVDEVLQTEFGLPDGLADTSKVVVDWDTGQTKNAKPVRIKKEVHRVQILDPAVGTGTFLAEVVKQIAPKVKDVAEGMWSAYIEKDLIPRLHGFELLMASYAMCHMKLDMVLTELGYKPTGSPPRLRVYLTNSLEEGEPANQTLPFAQWLSNEVKEANTIKRDMPIMVVIGNPPYSGESANKGDWIMRLMEAYKKEPGGKEKLKERNPKWINDDYVKFIRFSEHLIEKNGEGILGFISSHGYLDNPTFRGMRWHLMNTFDKIFVLDLHGNSNKKEKTPDGKSDKNVFDILTGVAIVIATKKGGDTKGKPLAEILHRDLWGERNAKYDALWKGSLTGSSWESLQPASPHYVLAPRNSDREEAYRAGFGVQEFMPVNSVGIVTARDALTIDMDKEELWKRVQDFTKLEVEELREKYNLGKDVRDWTVAGAKKDVHEHFDREHLTQISYRPFDTCWTLYTGNSRGFHCYPRGDVMRHYVGHRNIGLLAPAAFRDARFHHAFVTENISEVIFLSGTTASNAKNFPLYLYPSESDLDQTRRVNFDPKLWKKLKGLAKDKKHGEPDEIATFDYIYGVLHCPAYREAYAEFLKSDFPRIPWPSSPTEFWDVAEKGGLLRRLHLMEADAVGETPFPFKGAGDNEVDKPRFEKSKVFINAVQYFDGVPEVAWNFFIGGYQPAQKWLKDRKGRALTFEDVKHYQKIVKILAETDRIMKTIEMDLSGDADATEADE